MAKQQDDQFSEAEAARRRDRVIRRMANTPPQHRTTRQKAKKAALDRKRAKRGGNRAKP